MCTRQSRKVIWDMINTLFLTLTFLHLTDFFFCFPQALANIRPWLLVPFSQISLKNLSERNATHINFRDCRLHLFRHPFSKKLYIAVIVTAAALSYKLIKFLTISFFFCQDLQTMRDAFIDGMKTKAKGNKTGDTEKQPSRKQSFPRRFIQALFSNEENDENIAGEQLPADNKSLNESASKRSGEIDGCSSFKPKDQGEEEMLKGVKSLPNERKISVLVSIVYGLIGVDPATDEQMNEESKMDTNSASPGNSSVSIEHLGVDNEGYKCETELGVSALQTNTTKTVPRVTSGDLETARPVSPKPKTVRAWLKDPHLYKVI